jgi:hypothetical protein
MRQIFLEYLKRGAMTTEELARVLNRKISWVRNNSGPGKLIPRLPGKPLRFDPERMIDLFCAPVQSDQRSLTIEKHKTRVTPKGGYHKCL